MKKGKVRTDRIIILVLTGILVLGLLALGIYELFGLFFNDDKKIDNKPVVVETADDIVLSLIDYKVYFDDTDDLGFSFIIAEIGFDSKNQASFDLGNLVTSEKIALNNVSSYVEKLKSAGYDIESLDINVNGISSADKTTKAKIFIPFNSKQDSLSVYNSVNASKLEFDITSKTIPATSLKLTDVDDQIIEVEGAKITVSNSYISSNLYRNDVECIIGSTQKIFTFRINAFDIGDNVKIVDAQFLRTGESETINCLDDSYSTLKDNNAFNTALVDGDNGALFFEVRTDEIKPDFSGMLLIKFSNSEKIYEVPTIYE